MPFLRTEAFKWQCFGFAFSLSFFLSFSLSFFSGVGGQTHLKKCVGFLVDEFGFYVKFYPGIQVFADEKILKVDFVKNLTFHRHF